MKDSLLRTDKEITDIYNKHVDMVYKISMMLMKNIPEAEDVTQAVFVKLMTSNPRLDSDGHLKAWLIVTTRNTCKDKLKGWWYSKRSDYESIVEPSYNMSPSSSEVWDKIAALNEKHKLPVYLHYYEGYKTEEIADMLKVNHATIRSRLRAAKKKLKVLLEEE